jgi:dTDP-4-amino-4,6-dideoxygalactose transaminase
MPDREAPIPFNRPWLEPAAAQHVAQALAGGDIGGGGPYTARCEGLLGHLAGVPALLVHSGTAALELAALLLQVQPGDEVLMPAFTFPSTANAFVLRGAVPVFVDVREDTLNLDERLLAAAITPRTRGIVAVHYAGVACAMDEMLALASRHGLWLVEDAAQGLLARYRGRPLGSLGALGAVSFHATKGIVAGEAGALLLGDGAQLARAEVLRDKGTDRSAFLRGERDRYQWCDMGSSYPPSDLVAACLLAQLEAAEAIVARRLRLWQAYHAALAADEQAGRLRRPVVPEGCEHNATGYGVLLPDAAQREAVRAALARQGVAATFHYQPLHLGPASARHARVAAPLPVTESVASRLLRLPLWPGLEPHQARVIEAMKSALRGA